MSQTVIKLRFTHTRPTLRDRLAHGWAAFRALQKEAATRRQLATLDERALSDIGISRAQAHFVSETPIWDVHR